MDYGDKPAAAKRSLLTPPRWSLFAPPLTERLTGALLDRLTHHVNILEMNGDSYRLNQSRRRQTPTAN